MSAPALVPLAAAAAQRLHQLLSRDDGEEALLEEVLEMWRQAAGADAAAVYLHDGRGREACARAGGDLLPASLDGLDELPPRCSQQPLAGGVLVACGAALQEPPEPLPLLLASATRLCQHRQRLRQRDFEARYRGVELEAFYDVGLAIASTLDLKPLTEEILLRAVSLLDARRGALYLLQSGEYRLQSTIGGSARDALPGSVEHVPEEVLPLAHHLLAVPIEVEGSPRGLLVVGDKESRQGVGPFAEEDRRSLSLFANQAALALEQARLHQEALEKERLEREMELAAQIQREILPRALPTVGGYQLAGWTRPARHVGGDYYDAVELPGGNLGLVVADVSGKGVSAALLVAMLHSALRLLLDLREPHEEIARRLNAHLLAFSASNKFVTLFLAEVELATGRLTYLNAGHNPGLLVQRDGGLQRFSAGGVPLGLLPGVENRQGEAMLGPGDLLCLYSDGVTEATSPRDEELGQERLESLLVTARDEPLEEIRATIERELRELARGLPQGDDQTVLLLRRAGA